MRLLISLFMMTTALQGANQLSFEPNQGQTGSEVRYLARTPHGVLFFTDRELVLRREGEVRLELLGAAPSARWEPAGERKAETSYFVGRNESKWARALPGYSRLARRGVYPGIDAVFYGSGGRLEYDFVVAPRADASQIRFAVRGSTRIRIDKTGALLVETPEGIVRQRKPEGYQVQDGGGRRAIPAAFRKVSSDEFGFEIGEYDSSLPLVIDPVIESSTYLGGNGEDSVVATNGGISVGMTASIDFPGADFGRKRGRDIFICEHSPSGGCGRTSIYGGNGDDVITGVDLTSYTVGITIFGYTDSTDLPTNLSLDPLTRQPNPWQAEFAGGASDGFVLTRNFGQGGLFLTYFGGSGDDRITGGVNVSSQALALVGTTKGRELPSPSAPFEFGPGGGVDGFLAYCTTPRYSIPQINTLTYFGGTGDDQPLGASFMNGLLLIVGQTSSSDFPLVKPVQAQLSGDADGFVMNIQNYWINPAISVSTLIGGSGSDRATQVVRLSNGEVVVGGVTNSTDLPLLNPIQSTYGGGASDAFLARFVPDLSQVMSSTYFGGSGADEITTMASDFAGIVTAAGFTSSSDFPVRDAVQPAFGGGATDGFLLQLDMDGALLQATYLGGSGSDRVLGLFPAPDFSVTAVGQTNSPDFPIVDAGQETLGGSANGFLTRISSNLLGVGRVISGKDLRANVQVTVGKLNGLYPLEVQVSSSDPASVLVAQGIWETGRASTTLFPPQYGNNRVLYVDCLVESGGADLTLSAPGYPSKVVHANCYPARAVPSISGLLRQAENQYEDSVWSLPSTLSFNLIAVNPDKPGDWAYGLWVRPGTSPIVLQISSSNPAAASLSATTVELGNPAVGPGVVKFQSLAIGDVVLTFASARIAPPAAVSIHINSPIRVTVPIAVGSGFTCSLRASVNYPSSGGPESATFTSLNPDLVLLTRDPRQSGSPSLSVKLGPFFGDVYAQSVGPLGEASVAISIPGFDPVTAKVRVAQPMAAITGTQGARLLSTGQSELLSLSVAAPDSYACVLNPGSTPLKFTLDNSNPAAVTAPSTVEIPPPASYASIPIRAAGEGTTTISLRPPDGIGLRPGSESVKVSSRTKLLRLSDVELGKDLLTFMEVLFPSSLTAPVVLTVTSSDPSLVLVSSGTGGPGQGQFTVNVPAASTSLRFYVHGLAGARQATISVDAGALGKTAATVRLVPSGFAWDTGSYSMTLFTYSSNLVYFRAYALDPSTLIPVAAQGMRYGVPEPAFEFDNTNPDILGTRRVNATTIELSPKATGTASLILKTLPGYPTPSRGDRVNVKILAPSLQLSGDVIGKNLQSPLSLTVPGDLGSMITVTSSDASKLVLSTGPASVGTGSIAILPAQARAVFVQALDDRGSVTVTASAQGYKPASAVFPLTGSGIAILAENTSGGGSIVTGNKAQTTTQSPATRLVVILVGVDPDSGNTSFFGSSVGLRGGLSDLVVEVRSSDSNVGVIQRTPARLTAGQSRAEVEFRPVGAGNTEVSLVQPAGFMTPVEYAKVFFNVTEPRFAAPKLAFGKDSFGPATVTLPEHVQLPATNVPVTLTSADPARLLLSRDAETSPAASVTRTLIAGQRSTGSFYIHALGNTGIVPVKISAPGYAESILEVALADTAFKFDNMNPEIRAILQAGPQELRLAFAPAQVPDGFLSFESSIRPGVPDISVEVRSSDSGVLNFDTPMVLFRAGMSRAATSFRPMAPGNAAVTIVAPAGFTTRLPDTLTVTVAGAKLYLTGAGAIGRDLQTTAAISADSSFSEAVSLTVTSSDPSKLLVAESSTSAGQESIVVIAQPGSRPLVYLNSLAASGSALVTVTAAGYTPGTLPVTLAPSAAIFTTDTLTIQKSVSSKLYVRLAQLDPATLRPFPYSLSETPRPGANLSVSVSSSDPAVAVVSPATLTFVGNASQSVELRPGGAGTALISLGSLPGGVTPASGQQVVVNVVEPDISLPDFTLGYHLQVPVRLRLADRINVLPNDINLAVSSSDQYQVRVSNSASTLGANQVVVTIPAGQRQSGPFYVQGAGQSGSAQLQVQYQGNVFASTVTLDRAAFIFKEATGSPATLTAGAAASTYTIVPAVTAQGTPLIAPASIAPQASTKTIRIDSTNDAAIALSTPSVNFEPGDAEKTFTVRPLAPGSATIRLSGDAAYYFSAPASRLDVVVK